MCRSEAGPMLYARQPRRAALFTVIAMPPRAASSSYRPYVFSACSDASRPPLMTLISS
jgi:hypothetical protein